MIFLKKISIWYYLGLLGWAFIVILRKFGIYIPVVNNYLTDLYAVPMYCYTIEFLMTQFFQYKWKINLKFILTSTLYLTLIFEVFGPLFSEKFVGDFVDFLCYLAGGLIFFFVRKFFTVSLPYSIVEEKN